MAMELEGIDTDEVYLGDGISRSSERIDIIVNMRLLI